MRKTFPTEAAKIVTMIILLMSTVTIGLAQSPYALFGDNSKMLETTEESVPNSYGVLAKTANGALFYADFDLKAGIASLFDSEGKVIFRDSISENAKAMFTTIDPLCEKYYHLSPYSYCGGNPVNRIDLQGDSITFLDKASVDAVYNAIQPEINLSMILNNGVLRPESIQQIAKKSHDIFLQDLYAIAINPQMVEIATTTTNDYYIRNQFYKETWPRPSDIDYAKEYNK